VSRRVEAITALVRSLPAGPCARCGVRSDFVCWWHPDTSVCLDCPCPECGAQEGWLGDAAFPFLILAILFLSFLVADAIWEDQGRSQPPGSGWEAPWESTTASK